MHHSSEDQDYETTDCSQRVAARSVVVVTAPSALGQTLGGFECIHTRIDSFVGWPMQNELSPIYMAEAGFFYIGESVWFHFDLKQLSQAGLQTLFTICILHARHHDHCIVYKIPMLLPSYN